MYRQAAELPGCSVGITLLGRIYVELYGLYVSLQYLNPPFTVPLIPGSCVRAAGIHSGSEDAVRFEFVAGH